MRLKKAIKCLLKSPQMREKYSIFKVVHCLSFPIKYLGCFFFAINWKRETENNKKRKENNEQKEQGQICRTNTIESVSQVFLQACKEGSDYICFFLLCHEQANSNYI